MGKFEEEVQGTFLIIKNKKNKIWTLLLSLYLEKKYIYFILFLYFFYYLIYFLFFFFLFFLITWPRRFGCAYLHLFHIHNNTIKVHQLNNHVFPVIIIWKCVLHISSIYFFFFFFLWTSKGWCLSHYILLLSFTGA